MTANGQTAIIRRSTRLLNSVLQLHKQGFQNLVIDAGMSPSGMQWRCELHSFANVAVSMDGWMTVIDSRAYEFASHSSGENGNEYFGWTDAQSCNAYELAELIKTRFPLLMEQARGENFIYSGWLCSVIGRAESGELPVMYQDYGSGNCSSGPIDQIVKIAGIPSVFRKGPHLPRNSSWHTAYITIINAWRSAEIRILPISPGPEDDLLEHGAFWEGAIWYIQCILGHSRIDHFLDELSNDRNIGTSERWSTFRAVWNADGQLIHLIAFLKRAALGNNLSYKISDTRKDAYREDLRAYEIEYPKPERILPHPYYGGGNPLHLGGILGSLSTKII